MSLASYLTDHLMFHLTERVPAQPGDIVRDRLADLLLNQHVGIEERPLQRSRQQASEAGLSGAAQACQDHVHQAVHPSAVAESNACNCSKNVG